MKRIRLSHPRARAGFTLIEMLVALALTAVVGAAVTGLFVSQTRFFESQEKQGSAREVSRSATNVMVSELRMVEQEGGIAQASDSLVRINVPFAVGISCGVDGGRVVALLMPVSSANFNDALKSYSGYMWRSVGNDRYTYVATTRDQTFDQSGAATICTNQKISTTAVAGSRPISLKPVVQGAVPRSPVMLYQTITYRFAASTSVPGRRALYRQPEFGTAEELAAPFDTSARFRYYYGSEHGKSEAVAPGNLASVWGIELVLDGVSERPNSRRQYINVPLRTSVFFKNRR